MREDATRRCIMSEEFSRSVVSRSDCAARVRARKHCAINLLTRWFVWAMKRGQSLREVLGQSIEPLHTAHYEILLEVHFVVYNRHNRLRRDLECISGGNQLGQMGW